MPEAQTPPRRRRLAAFGAALPLLLVAGWFASTKVARMLSNAAIQAPVGRPLPAFRLTARDGRVWSDADLRGRQAVLHFFRSRCEGCEAEASAMRQLERALDPARVVLLHVMTDAVLGFPAELAAATLAQTQFQRPVLMADAAFVAALQSVRWSTVTPVTYVVDSAGMIRGGLRGVQTVASVQQALAANE